MIQISPADSPGDGCHCDIATGRFHATLTYYKEKRIKL
nr:MAG TPA: hypothetical protein [Caudoviricetes sp.]